MKLFTSKGIRLNHVFSTNKESFELFTVVVYRAQKPLINAELKS